MTPTIRIDGHCWTTLNDTHWMTLILNKLFTVRRDSCETRQLRQTCSCVMNVTWVAAFGSIPCAIVHVRSVFTMIVINDCHANAFFVSHITIHCKWCQSSFAIWIDDLISACTRSVFWYTRARYYAKGGPYNHHGFYCCRCIVDVLVALGELF